MALLTADKIRLTFGGIVALDQLSFSIERGAICGLIGPNGAGKTTIFNVISRLYTPSSGHIDFDGQDLLGLPVHQVAAAGIGRTFQNLALFPSMTLLENVMTGAHSQGRVGFGRAISRRGVAREERRLRDFAGTLLEELGLGSLTFKHASGLPFGTLKRLEMARALASRPRLLLLDEPAAGLTHGEVAELGETILTVREQFDLSILLVEHHMSLVMGVSDHVVAMNFGRKIASGTPAEVQDDPAVITAYLGASA